MKWISEKTLKDYQIFRYSKMGNGKEGVIPVKVEDLPGIEVGSDWGSPDFDKTVFIKFLEREVSDV